MSVGAMPAASRRRSTSRKVATPSGLCKMRVPRVPSLLRRFPKPCSAATAPSVIAIPNRQFEDYAAEAVLEFDRCAVTDQPALVDDTDTVREPVGLLEVLGGEHDGRAIVDQTPNQVPQIAAAGRVDAGRGFIEEQHLRAADERGGQVDAPAHPSGVRPDLPIRGVGEVDALQRVGCPPSSLAARQPVETSHQLDVLPSGQIVINRGVLAGQSDSGPHRLRVATHVEPGDAHHARVGLHQRGQDPDECRLSRPVRAKQPIDDARLDGQFQPVQGTDAAVEDLHHVFHADDRLQHRSPNRRVVCILGSKHML